MTVKLVHRMESYLQMEVVQILFHWISIQKKKHVDKNSELATLVKSFIMEVLDLIMDDDVVYAVQNLKKNQCYNEDFSSGDSRTWKK